MWNALLGGAPGCPVDDLSCAWRFLPQGREALRAILTQVQIL